MKYADVVRKIESSRDVPAREESFRRAGEGLSRLGLWLPSGGRGVIVVAGTNGKGSVCKTLETLFLKRGERVGLFTSPHLQKTTERIRVAGQEISEADFVRAFERVDAAAADLGLSHFETLTLMAAVVFFSGEFGPPVDRAIFEVGVGGLLDPTNLFPHEVSVITRLGEDHQQILGEGLDAIAAHKLGIVRPGNLVVHMPFPDEAAATVERVQGEVSARWVEPFEYSFEVRLQGREPQFRLRTPWGEAPLRLPGKRAAENAALALTVYKELGYDPSEALPCLAEVVWPGRMEKLSVPGSTSPVYLSGDHNLQGVLSLVELLEHYPRRHLHLVIAVAKNKNAERMLREYYRINDVSLYLTVTPFRPAPLSGYGEWLNRAVCSGDDPIRVFETAVRQARGEDLIVVSGSLYLVGLIRKHLLSGRMRSSETDHL